MVRQLIAKCRKQFIKRDQALTRVVGGPCQIRMLMRISPRARIQRFEGGQIEIAGTSFAICRAIEGVIVKKDQVPIAAEVHVRLDLGDTHLEGQAESGHRVLGGVT